ncbi:MAG: phosphoribosylglycinamide formyltransferase [Thermoguttaceae bacterium]
MTAASSKRPLRVAVLISGTGRTLKNLLTRIQAGTLHAEVVLVVANVPSAGGLQYATEAGVPQAVFQAKSFASPDEFSRAVFKACREAQAELVVLAGFIKRLTIPDDFVNRVVNIHPALVPSFCGKGFYGHHVHEAVLAYGAKLSGCTVHFVDNEYDHGPVILQKSVPVLDDDTPDTLAARVFDAETEIYPEAVQLIAQGRVTVDGRRVRVAKQ